MTTRRWLHVADETINSSRKRNGVKLDFDPTAMPKLWNATDLKPGKPVEWLAKQRIPRSAVSLLVGEEGIGKSLFWTWIIAPITKGTALADFGIPKSEPAKVILAVTEDDWQDTVQPRLQVAGANLDNIQVMCIDDDGSGAPVFPPRATHHRRQPRTGTSGYRSMAGHRCTGPECSTLAGCAASVAPVQRDSHQNRCSRTTRHPHQPTQFRQPARPLQHFGHLAAESPNVAVLHRRPRR
jgi:AAA domain